MGLFEVIGGGGLPTMEASESQRRQALLDGLSRDQLVEYAQATKEFYGWAHDPAQRFRQWEGADRIDAAWEAGDLKALRQAMAEFVSLMSPL